MTALQWFRDRFGLDPHLSQSQVYCEFLKRASRLASRGKASIRMGGYRNLEEAMFEPKDHVFILTVHGSKIKRPREVREWFKDFKM